MSKKVAIYARVSTSDQSVERQVRELREYAESRKWKIVHEAEEYVSGAADRRPQRDKVLDLARRRKIDAVLVLALDRWGRSVRDLVLTMAELEELGVEFIIPGSIGYDTSLGKMLNHFLAAVAEFERSLIRERVKSGLINARAKGKSLGRPKANADKVVAGLALLQKGKSYRETAKDVGVSVSTLLRARRKTKSEQSSLK